jgi:signal transduction histidine kinase
VRLLATPIPFERHRLTVIVGTSLAARDDALRSLTTLLLIGGPIALLLASLAAFWTVGAALRPVEAMRRRATEISAARSEQRLPVPTADDELRRLGETLNEMLDRLEAALERERAFVDDASHELRTPLALHKSELELALRYGGSREELRAAIASASEEADRLSQLAENLLVIARADKGRLRIRREPLAVSELFETVAGRLSDRARHADRTLAVDDPDGLVIEADRLRVEQALTNLVENALRHGGGSVRLWARAIDGVTELHVSDAGPGFPADFLPHAFERFRRADPTRGEGGAGLGLAIVDAVAHAHDGRAGARNAPQGGADVWIELG